VADHKEILRRLALSDARFMQDELGLGCAATATRLDPKTHALVRLGATLASDGALSSYQSAVEPALAAGASADDIVGALIAVAPTVGLARVATAAPELALALGYDVDSAIEELDGA
jgi:4-carboxymuconolactone decarboxylase